MQKKLNKTLINIFKKHGLSSSHAKICSKALINAELVGAPSHGLSRLKIKKTENNDLGEMKKLNWHEPYEDLKPNPNKFFRVLTKLSDESTAFIVDGGGTALYAGFQSAYIKNNQRRIKTLSLKKEIKKIIGGKIRITLVDLGKISFQNPNN